MPDIDVTFAGGVFVPNRPVDLPEGTRATIRVADESPADEPLFRGMREEDWPTTPEGIAALIAQWQQLEPLVFTPEEEAEIRASRKWWREQELDQLRREWGTGP